MKKRTPSPPGLFHGSKHMDRRGLPLATIASAVLFIAAASAIGYTVWFFAR